MKKCLSILLTIAILIGCSQCFIVDVDAASTGSDSQNERKGLLSMFWEWLFPEKETIEVTIEPIVGTPAPITPYDAYRIEVDKINNDALRNTIQLHRLDKQGNSVVGMCNLCSMETLLNRRVAYDFGDYSSPFDDYDMFAAIGVRDLGNGYEKKGSRYVYHLSGGVGSAQKPSTKYQYSDSVTYKPVLLGNSAVTERINATGLSGLDAQYKAIAELLQEHPEGIWLRTEYNTHAIVVTDYTEENGKIQLYGIDSVTVRDEAVGRAPIEGLYFGRKNYKNGLIGDTSNGTYRINIAYLEQVGSSTATHPQVPIQDRSPTLTVSDVKAPETLTQGSNSGLRGIVKTDCGTITSLYGAILDARGNVVQEGWRSPNKASDDLQYSINKDLIFGTLPAGEYVYRVQATAKNGSQEVTATLIDHRFRVEGTAETGNTPAPTTSQAKAPRLTISGENYPGEVKQGSNFGLRGTVSTDCGTLTNISGAILDSGGGTVQSGSRNANGSTVDIRDTINNDLQFGKLAAGNYTYRVWATAKNGSESTTQTLIDCGFRVYANAQKPAETTPPATTPPTTTPPATTPPATTPPATEAPRTPVLTISGENRPDGQKVGQNFGIRGTVSTDCGTITALYGAIYDSGGNVVQSGRYSPYSASVDLRTTINNDLVFGRLSAGDYTYYIQAVAENGSQRREAVLINHSFTVGSTASAPQDEPALNTVGYNMTVNVGAGSTLRFCATVSTADQYELGSISNGKTVYVYGTTVQQYEGRTWAKISYNGTDGWVNSKWLK